MRYPHAQWKGCNTNNFSTGPIRHRFIVVHVAGGENQGGTDAWFQNPTAKVSAHFSIGLNGEVHQYVDTGQTAYHCANWNDLAIGIEHLGLSGQHLTKAQIRSSKALMQWIRKAHGTRLVYTVNPNNPRGGVIGHGKIPEGPLSHPNCPGDPILADVQKFLRPNPVKRVVQVVTALLHYGRPGSAPKGGVA